MRMGLYSNQWNKNDKVKRKIYVYQIDLNVWKSLKLLFLWNTNLSQDSCMILYNVHKLHID